MKRFELSLRPLALVFSLIIIFAACETPEETVITTDGKLLTSEQVGTRFPLEAQILAQRLGLDSLVDSLRFNSDVYRITYKTLYKGNVVTASGIVCIPRREEAMDLLSFQHGTIVAHEDAPSVAVTVGDTSIAEFQYFSCLGMVLIFPDQIGFGSSTQFFHPYYVDEPSASAIIDMIAAARELVLEKERLLSGKLYLAGYSQGGYLTLSAHREMQFQGAPFGFNHTASYAASGGYLIKNVQEYFFSKTNYHQPFYLPYVTMAYRDFYDWDQPLTLYFQEPYASMLPDLFDGTNSGGDINSSLTTVMADLLNPDFLNGIDDMPEYQHVVDAMEANSIVDFNPTTFLVLYHGDQDSTVPYQSSVDAMAKFNSLGAGNSVSFVTLSGKSHETGVIPFVEDFLRRMGYF